MEFIGVIGPIRLITSLIGFGRAISDGEYQGAIYDVAVLPENQGKGVGRVIKKKHS